MDLGKSPVPAVNKKYRSIQDKNYVSDFDREVKKLLDYRKKTMTHLNEDTLVPSFQYVDTGCYNKFLYRTGRGIEVWTTSCTTQIVHVDEYTRVQSIINNNVIFKIITIRMIWFLRG